MLIFFSLKNFYMYIHVHVHNENEDTLLKFMRCQTGKKYVHLTEYFQWQGQMFSTCDSNLLRILFFALLFHLQTCHWLASWHAHKIKLASSCENNSLKRLLLFLLANSEMFLSHHPTHLFWKAFGNTYQPAHASN